MTEGYDPRNNGIAERVNGILKEEFLKHMDVRRDNIRQVLEDVINTYHTIFRQLILHFCTKSYITDNQHITNFGENSTFINILIH